MIRSKIKTRLHEGGNLNNMKIMSTFEEQVLGKLVYVTTFLGFGLSSRNWFMFLCF